MAIKSKNSGAYADIVGVSVKTAGNYAAVQGIYAKSGGSYESVFSGISEKTFSVTLSGITGATPSSLSAVVSIQNVGNLYAPVAVSRTTGKAPLAVAFDATGSLSAFTNRPFEDLYHYWDFGDETGETWAYGPNLYSKNIGIGPIGAHTYKTPGAYTWSHVCMDGYGNVRSNTGITTVTAWSEADTYYVDNGATPVAGVGGVPSDAVNLVNATTWAEVTALWAANKRVLCKRGATWACTATTQMPDGCEMGAYGTGAAPTVTSAGASQTPFAMSGGPSDVRIWAWKHTGPGPGVADSGMVRATVTAPTNLLLMDLESGGSTFGLLTESPTINNVFVNGCNFHGYGVTGISNNIALYVTKALGCYIQGSAFEQAPSHLVRISGTQKCLVDSLKFRDADGAGNGRHALTIREMGDSSGTWTGDWTDMVYVSNLDIDTVGTTANRVLQVAPTNTGIAGRFRRIVIERNLISSDLTCMRLEVSEQLTVRNNICRSTDDVEMMWLGNANTTGNPSCVGGRFYNNTLYKTGTGAFSAITLADGVADTQVVNNLAYSPNATSPVVLLLVAGPTGTYAANNSPDADVLNTRPWAAAAPVLPAEYTPSNYAIGAGATLTNVPRDFFNAALSGSREIGAIQA